MIAALFTLACALPVLLAWHVGTRAIDGRDYGLRGTPKARVELSVASVAPQRLGERRRDAGGRSSQRRAA